MRYVLAIILLNFSLSLAQGITVKGRVTDSVSNQPVQSAGVFISANHLVYTNGEGYYAINSLPEGNYSIKVLQIGYKSFYGSINVP